MGVLEESAPEEGGRVGAQPLGPRLTPTPDYGTLGPESDFGKSSAGDSATSARPATATSSGVRQGATKNLRLLRLVAMMGGIVAALLASGGGSAWEKITGSFSPKNDRGVTPAKYPDHKPDRQQPQNQAETLQL